MKHNLNRVLSTLALSLLTCIGLWAGEVIKVVKPDANAGTVVSTVSDGVCTLTVTPATGFYLTADNLKAVATLNENGMQAPRRDMPIDPGTELEITPTNANANPSGVTTYTFNWPEDENINVEVTAEFQAGSCYYLRIGGTWVTSENAEDILDDLYDDDHVGTMSFDAENKRLIVSDVGEWPFDIESGVDALTIKVSGENKFYSESNAAISYIGNGQGTLTLVKDEQATVCSLELLSYTNNKSAISGFGSFNYDGFYVHSDVSGVVYDTNSKTLNDATGAPVNSVKFSTVETYYDLWYEYGDDRIQVTNENQDDITGDENEQGEPQVSFRYDPETKRNILTLNSAVLTGTFATTISPIYINLNGTNVATESAGTFLRYEGYLDVADAIYTTTSSSPTTLTFDNCFALQGMRASYQNGLALIQSPTDNQPAIVGTSYGIAVETGDAVHYVTILNYTNVLEEILVDDMIDFIKSFRNIKAENNITKEMKVMFDTEDDNELIVKMLKLEDNVVKEPLGIKAYKVFSNRVKAQIFFEKIETEADKAAKKAQIEFLKASIARREKLLSNDNYVKKAPANIVEMDRQKLVEEKAKLEELMK